MISRFLIALALLCPLFSQSREVDVTAGAGWVDTGIDLQPGDIFKVTASGSIRYATAQQPSGPAGLSRGWADLIRQLPVNEAGRGALVGRIGASEAARAFLIGPLREGQAPIGGRLFVGINQMSNDTAGGSFHVSIVRTPGAASVQHTDVRLPKFTQELIDSLPGRVNDPAGAVGDRVNFILVGSLDQVQTAFRNAGWLTVDRTRRDALLRGALATFSKAAYVTLPMSELELFGRVQDFGYAQADPLRVIAARHHFRLWKAPFELDGQTVWVGAGTHDIGFDRDQRNNGITHKIDPDTDKEREYILESLSQTGMVAKSEYMTTAKTITKARTAHGEEFTTDGRTLIVYFPPDAPKSGTTFSDLFCSVLQKNPGGGNWSSCDRYIETPGKTDAPLAAISKAYRVLIVPGILSSCVSDTPAFMEGQETLKQAGVDVDLLQVPNDSSEQNAKLIAQYVREHSAGDPRKYILIGYSKGTPDIQVALAQEAGLVDKVAAFVTVAGASGGSPIADILPKQAEPYMTKVPMAGCKGDLSLGFKSLKREVRQAFLASYPRALVPTYSLIGKSDKTTTSKSLMETWQMLASFGQVQDGQLVREDAIAPGAKYLGAALADHFAIALPFEKSKDATVKAGMDRNIYPRAALLEALVRFVTADLGAGGSTQ